MSCGTVTVSAEIASGDCHEFEFWTVADLEDPDVSHACNVKKERFGDIYVHSTDDGVDWVSKVRTGEQTGKSIKLCGGHKLAVGFQGKSSDTVYCMMSRDGVGF